MHILLKTKCSCKFLGVRQNVLDKVLKEYNLAWRIIWLLNRQVCFKAFVSLFEEPEGSLQCVCLQLGGKACVQNPACFCLRVMCSVVSFLQRSLGAYGPVH